MKLGRLRPSPKKEGAIFSGGDNKTQAVGDDEETVRVETSLVVCPVLVLDRQGRPVRGLKSEDFVVTEDGRAQEISTFAPGEGAAVPRSIILVMDYSGSLLPYMETSVEAAKALVDKLGPGDRMAVVTDEVKLLADFTRDKAELKSKLESLKEKARSGAASRGWGSGHSFQYSALLASLRELVDDEALRPVIIFQTDGDELAILRPVPGDAPRGVKALARDFSLADVYRAAESSRATIYPVIPGVRLVGLAPGEERKKLEVLREHALRDRAGRQFFVNSPWAFGRRVEFFASQSRKMQLALSRLAGLTGGWAEFLEDPSQAGAAYSRILSDVNRRYVIGYYPTNKERDGRRRNVNIVVRGHPEYTVAGRKSYYAPDPDE